METIACEAVAGHDVGTFATTEIEGYFMNACMIYNNKAIAMGRNRQSAGLINPMPELDAKPECLESRRFEESAVPAL